MEQLVQELTRGNVIEVKVVLATVALALAVYQVALISVAYGKARLPFLARAPASWAHRASGDAIVVLTVVVAVMCVSYDGVDAGDAHAAAAVLLLVALALKVVAVRAGGRLGRLLPPLGMSVLALFALTWLTSAGDFLGAG